jgi:hypothetical protein
MIAVSGSPAGAKAIVDFEHFTRSVRLRSGQAAEAPLFHVTADACAELSQRCANVPSVAKAHDFFTRYGTTKVVPFPLFSETRSDCHIPGSSRHI